MTAVCNNSSSLPPTFNLSPSLHNRSSSSFSSDSVLRAIAMKNRRDRPPNVVAVEFCIAVFLHLTSSKVLAGDLDTSRTYIVRFEPDAKPSVFPTHRHWYDAAVAAKASGNNAVDGGDDPFLIHTYSSVFHGFSARLSPSSAASLSAVSGVVAVIPELVRFPDTTRSPHFLGLSPAPPSSSGLLKESDFGSDLVIAVVDTGISPEHRSFSDRGIGPVPSTWRGECAVGPSFPSTSCNRKIVGARFFSGGYEATSGRMNESSELRSPRDTDGHGSHTASIAAGRYVYPASTLGYARGVAAGMAPKARLAAYKVCWKAGCFDSDILAAFDAAVSDGADVISLSVGGVVVPYYLDSIAIGAFSAAESGVFVSASAGNGGPGELTVTNVAPWMTTVGAGSMDRKFPADVHLGDGRVLPGVSVYGGPGLAAGRLYPLFYADSAAGAGDGYAASLCLEESLHPNSVEGKIVVCDRGVNSRAAKGEVVRKAGGAGMILANGVFDGEGLVADCHVIPATAVGAAAGSALRAYIAATGDTAAAATIVFHGTRLGIHPAPTIASFSAHGPNPQSPAVLKPDVIAPGLDILAAWPETVGPAGIPSDRRRTEFNILSGTSMACPHVSGLAALLKAAHPGWSPAAVRSALMTTAYTSDNRGETIRDESTGVASDVFARGAGHVDPQRAMDPGLVYDVDSVAYVDFLCHLNYTAEHILAITRRRTAPANCGARRLSSGHLNYPSMVAVFDDGPARRRMSQRFFRTATNVGGGAAVYRATVREPDGVKVAVEPSELVFRREGQKLSFSVRVAVDQEGPAAAKLTPGSSRVSSGALTWTDGRHVVRSPIAVILQAPL